MNLLKISFLSLTISLMGILVWNTADAQNLTPRYATLELFTNTPCPVCGSTNPGMFSRLAAYEGQYHLISFYPGKPYSNCIFYQANISENNTRFNFYNEIFGSPTVAINGTQFKSSSGVTNAVLDAVTGDSTWLHIQVEETSGSTRNVNITLNDLVGGSATAAKLYAVIVEKEVLYNAPNGETVHHNVFRKFLTTANGVDVDLSTGMGSLSFEYTLNGAWKPDEIYVVAWVINPDTKEIYNSGTRFDPPLTTATIDLAAQPKLTVYPNPASSEINIILPEEIINVPVTIYDINGKIVHQQTASGKESITIGVGLFPTGYYQIGIAASKGLLSGRFEVVR